MLLLKIGGTATAKLMPILIPPLPKNLRMEKKEIHEKNNQMTV
jgi:hypothetical protein